ncbi:MAG: D-alanine--D-alanine ligase family protein [Bacteroidota bacterium]|jgi:D-alanine-D-alanine ligase
MKTKTIAVLFGGRSGEHEVSLVSAESVMKALDPARYTVVPVGVDKDGRWWTGTDALSFLRSGGMESSAADSSPRDVEHATAGVAPRESGRDTADVAPRESGRDAADVAPRESGRDCRPCFLPPDPTRRALLVRVEAGWEEISVDVVFPVIHGTFGEDGTMQGLFELADLPYVGAGVAGSAVAMDKVLQKRLHRDAGLPVPEFLHFHSTAIRERAEDIATEVEAALGMPLFVKPPNLGSSVGISKAHNRSELITALRHAAQFDRKVLIERAVPEAREIEVAVLGNQDPVASIPGEVVPSNDFYDYDAKYVDGASALHIPADLPVDLADRIRALAVEAFRTLDCEGMARVDFLLSRTDGALYINEINTIPGFTSISMYPKLFAAVGIPYPELLDRLIALAERRHAEQRALLRSYTPKTDWHRRDG